jgi:hypothetical protein
MFHTAIGTWRFGTIREDFADFNESLLTNFMSAPVSLFALLFPFESHLLRFLPHLHRGRVGALAGTSRWQGLLTV